MNRQELEKQVFDIEFGSMEHNGAAAEILEEIRAASTEDLEFYLKEYKEHLAFVAAVESLQLKER